MKVVKSIRNVTLCTHVQLVCNGVTDQYLFIFSVFQQPSHQVLFIPVKNNKQRHVFIPAVKFLLSGKRQEQRAREMKCSKLAVNLFRF